MNYELFDARNARMLTERARERELWQVLDKIKERAENEGDSLTIYSSLKPETIEVLHRKDFNPKYSPGTRTTNESWTFNW